MLPSHEHVATYNDHEVYRRKPGFEFTPILLGKIASFLVQAPDGGVASFAFMYSMLLVLNSEDIREEQLLADALRRIEELIEQGTVSSYQDKTMEYHSGTWVEVSEPRWWISTMPR